MCCTVDTNCAEEPVPTGAANQQTKQLLEPPGPTSWSPED